MNSKPAKPTVFRIGTNKTHLVQRFLSDVFIFAHTSNVNFPSKVEKKLNITLIVIAIQKGEL